MKNSKKRILGSESRPFSGHEFKKSLGQNFIRDTNLLRGIVRDADVTKSDVVVEVGAGAGTLTKELVEAAAAVLSYEVDKSLALTLGELETEHKNLKIVFNDALKTENDEIFDAANTLAGGSISSYKVVANIPYYITTPLIFKFLKDPRVTSITVMVQKEVAERIASSEKDSEYGGISVLVQYYGETSIKRIVKKEMFYPVPKVDSAILSIVKRPGVDHEFAAKLSRVVKVAFQTRRKLLINNLSTGLGCKKEDLLGIFSSLGISLLARAEELSIDEFSALTQKLDSISQI